LEKKTFRVYVYETEVVTYLVEAETAEEAGRLVVENSEGERIDGDYVKGSCVLDSVEEVN